MTTHMLPLFEEQRQAPIWPNRPRLLLSYAYAAADDKQVRISQENGVDLIIDSGAFTVANSGGVIDHAAYLAWLAERADAITFALSLDVIGDHPTSLANHERALETVGDKVQMVPTWHFGSSFADLRDLCRRYQFVSIGGAVPFAKQPAALFTAAAQAHRIAAEYGTRLHGLGMTGNRIMYGLPWYSVDSSSWLAAVRFPSLPLTDEHGRVEQFEHGRPLDGLARALVRQYGGDPAVVASEGWCMKAAGDAVPARRQWVLGASARSFMYVEAYKNAYQPAAPLKVYLSGTSPTPGGSAQMVSDAWRMGNPWTTPTPLNPEDWN